MIHILPPQLANQIAAGEVVERPASVVKELVENALDSGATQIDVDIERGGHKRILVKDNGKGIEQNQLKLALARHATSKISDINDLEAISSLGFRGEALASISSVSRLTISSKPAGQNQAWSAIAEGVDMDVIERPCAHPNGTSVEVLDLFFNTPGRRKFLRAEKTEFSHIDTLIKRIALSCPNVSFNLKHNNKFVHRYKAFSDDQSANSIDANKHRIEQVISSRFIDQTSAFFRQYDDIKIEVWIKDPHFCVSANPAQYSFVNGRMMRDKLIQHAIRQAYGETLQSEQLPEYVIFITLPADQVDVNVHPAKHEVRFHHARLLHDLLLQSINEALTSFKQQTESNKFEQYHSASDNSALGVAESLYTNLNSSPPTQSFKTDLRYHQDSKLISKQEQSNNAVDYEQLLKPSDELSSSIKSSDIGKNGQPDQRNTGEIFNVIHQQDDRYWFITVSGEKLVWVVDLELLIADSAINQLSKEALLATPLLVPVRLKLAQSEIQWCQDNLDALKNYGFDIVTHSGYLIVKQVPNILRQQNGNNSIIQLLNELMKQDELESINQLIIKTKSKQHKMHYAHQALKDALMHGLSDEFLSCSAQINPDEIFDQLGKS